MYIYIYIFIYIYIYIYIYVCMYEVYRPYSQTWQDENLKNRFFLPPKSMKKLFLGHYFFD